MNDEAKPEVKILSADDPIDFSYPEGFEQVVASLTSIPDEAMRSQMVVGLAQFAIFA
jgi:hypothetical protein